MTTKTAVFTTTTFEGVPRLVANDIERWSVQARNAINNSLNGKTNTVGTFTLNASTVSTSIKFARGNVGQNTVLVFVPITSNAAAVAYDGSMFVSSRDVDNDVISLTHTSDANTDKTFYYVLIG